MPSTVSAASSLLTQIEILVTAADLCAVDRYQLTAGEPAQPSGQCSQISVWASQFFNAVNGLFHEDDPCVVVRGVQLNYRIDLCYTETEKGRTVAQHEADAICLYGLADAVWCGLNVWLAAGAFGNCNKVAHDPLSFDSPFGGMNAASGGIRFQWDCTPTAAPEDVVGVIAGQEEGQDFG